MLIYRIEHPNTLKGPYRSLKSMATLGISHHKWSNGRPNPGMDKFEIERPFISGKHCCGFNSKKKLLKWFRKRELKAMFKAGYVIKILPIHRKKVILGKRQILIDYKYWLKVNNKAIIIRNYKSI